MWIKTEHTPGAFGREGAVRETAGIQTHWTVAEDNDGPYQTLGMPVTAFNNRINTNRHSALIEGGPPTEPIRWTDNSFANNWGQKERPTWASLKDKIWDNRKLACGLVVVVCLVVMMIAFAVVFAVEEANDEANKKGTGVKGSVRVTNFYYSETLESRFSDSFKEMKEKFCYQVFIAFSAGSMDKDFKSCYIERFSSRSGSLLIYFRAYIRQTRNTLQGDLNVRVLNLLQQALTKRRVAFVKVFREFDIDTSSVNLEIF